MRTSRQILKQARRALVAALIFSGGINVLMLAMPIYTLQVFETVVPSGSIETLILLTLMIGGATLALALIEIVRDRILLRAGLWLDHVLGSFLIETGLRSGSSAIDLKHDARALQGLRTFISSGAIGTLFDAPWVPIFLVTLALLHPLLGVAGAVAAVLLFGTGLLQCLLAARVAPEAQKGQERAERWWAMLAERGQIAGALGLATGATSQWEAHNRTHVANAYSLGKRTSVLKAVARAIRLAAQVSIYALGAFLVIRGDVTPGVLVAAAILLGRALAPLEQSVTSFRAAGSAWTAYKRLRAIADTVRPPGIAEAGHSPEGRLTIAGVTYYYPTRRTPALRNLTFELEPSMCLAIVGPNGAGKSSLSGLIAGALLPTQGAVQLDGVAVGRWQRSDTLPPIGYMPEPILIEGTVHDNIARFSDASHMGVARAAMRAGVHDMLSALPNGYDTAVGAGGEALSLRERRAVALARALHGEPRIVVLDEPELGLDAVGVRRLRNVLAGLKAEGVGIVIATQDQRLLSLADRMAILANGAVEDYGPADQVAKRLMAGKPVAAVQSHPHAAPTEAAPPRLQAAH
ncbi:MAG TPA: ATP-binding cassette domain-containing protein [Hyphomicrobiaceae bacterium]|nr:ATP-binding cassette domain-containing protein [Hyphomicrobiaceae bacterium]